MSRVVQLFIPWHNLKVSIFIFSQAMHELAQFLIGSPPGNEKRLASPAKHCKGGKSQ